MLEGGTLRSLGNSADAVALVSARPEEFPSLIEFLWDADPVVRMRAADAAEKITRERPELLQPYRRELLGLLEEAQQQELRWHLALMVPRMKLSSSDSRRVYEGLCVYLAGQGSIARTLALQGMADLAANHPELRDEVIEQLQMATRSGTAAMKARARNLLKCGLRESAPRRSAKPRA